MGAIDAFVSHSWSDDADTKVHRLRRWFAANAAHQAATGEGSVSSETGTRTGSEEVPVESLVWIDVACLNQFRIDIDLLCLPFFILASKQFVGLVGPTFPSRLWCLSEVFLAIQLRGGREESPCVMIHLGADSETPDGLSFQEIFGACDAARARCHEIEDRDHLLAVIESSFGSIRRFNNILRSMKLS